MQPLMKIDARRDVEGREDLAGTAGGAGILWGKVR